jgi:D-alanyl-D-alanine carboxypeptidase
MVAAMSERAGALAALLEERVGARGAAALAVSSAEGTERARVGLPAAAEARFLAYSITKSLLAALVLQLCDEGRLSLEDPLARFAPEVPRAGEITLRQVLSHTAGLPDYGALAAYHAAVRERPADPWSFEEFAAHTFARGLDAEPGERFAYSNPGYALLRRLVEAETGAPFRAVVAARLARPLGLAATEVVESLEDLAGLVPAFSRFGLAAGELRDVRKSYHPGWVWHGVVASTPEDVCVFYRQLFEGAVGSPAALEEMTRLVPVEVPWPRGRPGYGLGLMGSRDRPLLGHNGGGPGYTASAWCARDAAGGPAAACAMLAFEEPSLAEDLAHAALDLVARNGLCDACTP